MFAMPREITEFYHNLQLKFTRKTFNRAIPQLHTITAYLFSVFKGSPSSLLTPFSGSTVVNKHLEYMIKTLSLEKTGTRNLVYERCFFHKFILPGSVLLILPFTALHYCYVPCKILCFHCNM